MSELDVLREVANIEPAAITELEWTILLAVTVAVETRRKAAAELVYLKACTAEVEALMGVDATDATIAMFFKRDAKKLLKLRPAKVTK